eukprot:gene9210-12421_t
MNDKEFDMSGFGLKYPPENSQYTLSPSTLHDEGGGAEGYDKSVPYIGNNFNYLSQSNLFQSQQLIQQRMIQHQHQQQHTSLPVDSLNFDQSRFVKTPNNGVFDNSINNAGIIDSSLYNITGKIPTNSFNNVVYGANTAVNRNSIDDFQSMKQLSDTHPLYYNQQQIIHQQTQNNLNQQQYTSLNNGQVYGQIQTSGFNSSRSNYNPQRSARSNNGGNTSFRSPNANVSNSGTGGSNAQGRAINQKLLEILKERVIDPHKLDVAIENYVDRMDCVNVATLLFHTGKKRMLLAPSYIRRISDRLNSLREELRAREASNALYGLKCMSSEIIEVRELILAVANKVASSSTEFVAQAVGNALYGCQMMTSDHEEVRYLLHVLAGKVGQCTELLEAQNVGNALYGMRGMNSDCKEVRALISALTPKIATAREDLNGQALGNSLYGLQSMSSKEPEVRALLSVLATKVSRTWEELKAQEVGNALYGLKRMSTDVPEFRVLLAALTPKIQSSPEILDAQAIGNSLYGFQNMSSNNKEVLSLLSVIAEKINMSTSELDGQAMGNSVYGLQGMSSEFLEVRSIVTALTAKIQTSILEMNAQEMGNALYGLQNMSSDHVEVRRLITALTKKVGNSKHELTSQEIGNALFGLQGISSSAAETRLLVRQLATKIQQSHSILDPQGVSNSLFGLQRMSSESEDVRYLIIELTKKIEQSWKLLSPQQLTNALYGLQCLSSSEIEVRALINALVPKLISCRDEMTAKQISSSIFGMRNFFSSHKEVISLLSALSEKLSYSNEGWTINNLAMALFGLQGFDTNTEEVRLLLNLMIPEANHVVASIQNLFNNNNNYMNGRSNFSAEMNMLGNCFYGLQRMSSSSSEVSAILSALVSIFTLFSNVNASVSSKLCANILFGINQCSFNAPQIKQLLYKLSINIRSIIDKYISTEELLKESNYDNILTSAYSYGDIKNISKHDNMKDVLENIICLYQSLSISLQSWTDLDEDPNLSKQLLTLHLQLEEIISKGYPSEYTPRNVTNSEKKLIKDLSSRLVDEPLIISANILIFGFDIACVVKLKSDVNVTLLSGELWQPCVYMDVRGSSYNYPSKELFISLRNNYLGQKKGIKIEILPSESFSNGPRDTSLNMEEIFKPFIVRSTLEEANHVATQLQAIGAVSARGLLSSITLYDNVNSNNRSAMNTPRDRLPSYGSSAAIYMQPGPSSIFHGYQNTLMDSLNTGNLSARSGYDSSYGVNSLRTDPFINNNSNFISSNPAINSIGVLGGDIGSFVGYSAPIIMIDFMDDDFQPSANALSYEARDNRIGNHNKVNQFICGMLMGWLGEWSFVSHSGIAPMITKNLPPTTNNDLSYMQFMKSTAADPSQLPLSSLEGMSINPSSQFKQIGGLTATNLIANNSDPIVSTTRHQLPMLNLSSAISSTNNANNVSSNLNSYTFQSSTIPHFSQKEDSVSSDDSSGINMMSARSAGVESFSVNPSPMSTARSGYNYGVTNNNVVVNSPIGVFGNVSSSNPTILDTSNATIQLSERTTETSTSSSSLNKRDSNHQVVIPLLPLEGLFPNRSNHDFSSLNNSQTITPLLLQQSHSPGVPLSQQPTDEDDEDVEIALLEKQLEIKRMEVRLLELKAKKKDKAT